MRLVEKSLLEKLGFKSTPLLNQSIQKVDNKRIRDATRKITVKYLNQRKKLRSQRKNKEASNKIDYNPGAFSAKSKPVTTVQTTNKESIPITFIPDESIIMNFRIIKPAL